MARKFAKIEVLGVKETIRGLNSDQKGTKDGIASAMSQIALFEEGQVKLSIAGQKAEPRSVDTGRFLNSIQSDSNSDSATMRTTI